MKPKQIISFILAVMLCAGCFGGLSVTAEELLSYTWDLTNCGEASGYVTPEDGAKQNNCTTLVAGETVSAEYTKKSAWKNTPMSPMSHSMGNSPPEKISLVS